MNTSTADPRPAAGTGQPAARPLRRSGDDKMLAGVAGRRGADHRPRGPHPLTPGPHTP